MLDYKLLEALDMVARAGSFDGAARRLHLTQSAVSQRIRQLEEKHGCVLLSRDPVAPTPEGERLLAHVRRVQQLEAELARDAGAADAWRSVAIGVNADSLAVGLIAALAPALAAQHILLDCVIDDEAYTLESLRRGAVVGCIASESAPVPGCAVRPLGGLDYLPVATPDFAERYFKAGLNAAALAAAPAAVFAHRDSLHRRWLREAHGLAEGSYPAHVIPESNALYAAALAGIAYAVVPKAQAAAALRAGRLVGLGATTLTVPLFWHHWTKQSPVAEQIGAALVEFAAGHFNPLPGEPS
ncbi:ArgP/LysG family DNA-binding transcriptional regulator [Jeongeupia naejangsanensis]|uniref:ArgP/LysG family DNA-binding transcriptional regulator n=1 Tax=Jeongeupia naejangsanensis TaxID=613195 RepID=A0ABS2BI97_9NEIS|nr:ArgP/LysG family DNA-binding transcriptional regulator [Jeongeupia naejangsanensis]MBM3115321.1 ArgP/LysG family DNA-binding transcriptional regulator [Jeongeupia naejangsanensis]